MQKCFLSWLPEHKGKPGQHAEIYDSLNQPFPLIMLFIKHMFNMEKVAKIYILPSINSLPFNFHANHHIFEPVAPIPYEALQSFT